MSQHFNELTPEQDEALTLLAEECSEVVQIICKIQRHGLHSSHPSTHEVNYAMLQKEVGDVLAAMRIAEVQRLLSWSVVLVKRDAKMQAVQQYLHHAKVWPSESEEAAR